MPAPKRSHQSGSSLPILVALAVIAGVLAVAGPDRLLPGRQQSASGSDHSAAGADSAPYRSPYDDLIVQKAQEHDVDPDLMRALFHWESGYDPDAISSAGALGLGQLMPATAAKLGIAAPLDPAANIDGATRLVAQLLQRFDGQTDLALAGYNAGESAVAQYAGVPPYPETIRFVAGVSTLYQAYQSAGLPAE